MTNKKNNRTGELFSVKYSKMLSFSQVAEALMGLIYHRPSGENFSSVFKKLKNMQTFCSETASLDRSACNAILLVLLSLYQLGSGSISKGTTEHRTGHHL